MNQNTLCHPRNGSIGDNELAWLYRFARRQTELEERWAFHNWIQQTMHKDVWSHIKTLLWILVAKEKRVHIQPIQIIDGGIVYRARRIL